MAKVANKPGLTGHLNIDLEKSVVVLDERVETLEQSPGGGGGDPTSAQCNLNWRNGNDGEYYGHADTATPAFGDLVMYDPRKNAPGSDASASEMNVTLPAITSADYGKVVKVACQYDTVTGYIYYGGYADGIAGKVRFVPNGADLIADTYDTLAYSAYQSPYTDWVAGENIASGYATDSSQGPFVCTLMALPPDDDAVYATARWAATTETLNMGSKSPLPGGWGTKRGNLSSGDGGLQVVPVSGSGTTVAVAGQLIYHRSSSGTPTPTVQLPLNPTRGDVVEIFIQAGGTATVTLTIDRNGQNIHEQAQNAVITSSGLNPLKGGWVRCEFVGNLGFNAGWLIRGGLGL